MGVNAVSPPANCSAQTKNMMWRGERDYFWGCRYCECEKKRQRLVSSTSFFHHKADVIDQVALFIVVTALPLVTPLPSIIISVDSIVTTKSRSKLGRAVVRLSWVLDTCDKWRMIYIISQIKSYKKTGQTVQQNLKNVTFLFHIFVYSSYIAGMSTWSPNNLFTNDLGTFSIQTVTIVKNGHSRIKAKIIVIRDPI